jgi:cell division protein FtsB
MFLREVVSSFATQTQKPKAMNRKILPAKKKWYLLVWPLLLLISVLLIIWSPNGLLHLRQLNIEHQDLSRKNLMLEQENHRLYQEINRLRDDPTAIENLARQELGLAKEGELIFQFVPSVNADDLSAE